MGRRRWPRSGGSWEAERKRESVWRVGTMRTLCDACESAAAILFCAADEAALCRACDEKVLFSILMTCVWFFFRLTISSQSLWFFVICFCSEVDENPCFSSDLWIIHDRIIWHDFDLVSSMRLFLIFLCCCSVESISSLDFLVYSSWSSGSEIHEFNNKIEIFGLTCFAAEIWCKTMVSWSWFELEMELFGNGFENYSHLFSESKLCLDGQIWKTVL